MANVIFKVGTKALFDALEQKDTNTLYWLEDVQELYKGNLLFATGKTASETAAGLMSADDKIKLDSLSPGTLMRQSLLLMVKTERQSAYSYLKKLAIALY